MVIPSKLLRGREKVIHKGHLLAIEGVLVVKKWTNVFKGMRSGGRIRRGMAHLRAVMDTSTLLWVRTTADAGTLLVVRMFTHVGTLVTDARARVDTGILLEIETLLTGSVDTGILNI